MGRSDGDQEDPSADAHPTHASAEPRTPGPGAVGSAPGVRGAKLTVRTGTEPDAAAVAALHASQITEGFLSFLGPSFLTRLYRRIIRTPGSFLLVAEDRGAVIGFVAGSRDVGALYRTFIARDGLAAAVGSAGRLLRSWRKVGETLRHGTSSGSGTGRGIELLSIAVDPGLRGRGVGRALVTAFLDQVRSQGDRAAYVVVASDNAAAIALYANEGFANAAAFELHRGVTSLLLQWDRPPGGTGPRTAT